MRRVAARIAGYMGEMIALDDQPFSMMENVGLMCLICLAFPPSPKHTIPCMCVESFFFEACGDRVKAQLARTNAGACAIHFT